MPTQILELRRNILNHNDQLARSLRGRLHNAGVTTFNWVSSPGTGKTELLRRVLEDLVARGLRTAALVGDLATDNDAQRLALSGSQVRQIETHTICHLEAKMVEEHLAGWDLNAIDLLFIENIGNLVCPAGWDLGEDVRVVLLSATEGEDKPLKYPKLFNSADIAVITKIDLAGPCEFNLELAKENIRKIRPGIEIFETSARKGIGVEEFTNFVASFHHAPQAI
jgi:hydrogenase nickel incorporation protein HypB